MLANGEEVARLFPAVSVLHLDGDESGAIYSPSIVAPKASRTRSISLATVTPGPLGPQQTLPATANMHPFARHNDNGFSLHEVGVMAADEDHDEEASEGVFVAGKVPFSEERGRLPCLKD